MRPHASASRRGARQAARTRLHRAVGWLRGFPASPVEAGRLPWRTIPRLGWPEAPDSTTVDGLQVSRTVRRLNELERRFPRALPTLVGDVRTWRARIDVRLELIKGLLQAGGERQDLPQISPRLQRRVEALARARPDLAPLLEALLWSGWESDAELAARLEVLEQHPRHLQVLLQEGGDTLAMRIVDLAAARELGAGLLGYLGDQRAWTVPIPRLPAVGDLIRRIHDARRSRERLVPQEPGPTGGDHAEVVSRLQGPWRHARQRRRQLAVLELLVDPGTAARHEAWWSGLDELRREANRVLGRRPLDPDRLDDVVARIRQLGNCLGHQAPLPAALDLVHDLDDRAFEHLLALLRALPPGSGKRSPRRRFLDRLHPCFETPGRRAARDLLGCLRRTWTALTAPGCLVPGRKQVLFLLGLTTQLGWQFAADHRSRRLLPLLHRSLPVVLEGHYPLPDGWLEHLLALLEELGDPAQAARVVGALPVAAPDRWFDATNFRLAARISRGDPARYATVLRRLDRRDWRSDLGRKLADLMLVEDLTGWLGPSLLDGDGALVRRVLGRLVQLRALDATTCERLLEGARRLPAGAPLDPIDLALYPNALHPALRQLQQVDPRAGRTAARILGKDFRAPGPIAAEIEVLRRALPDAPVQRRPHLALRLERLERRGRAQPVSPARLERYRSKLQRRTRQLRLEGLLAEVEAALPRKYTQIPDRDLLLSAILTQDPPVRALGLRLLQARAGPAPWDLRDHDANRRFLEAAQAQGLDLRPWIDPEPPRPVEAADGTRLWLQLERDPLQVLEMGQAFATCLAPGASNFHAAIGTAADLNKQVLYARDARRRVLGRCLVALTTDWGLRTHQVYTTSAGLQLEPIVAAFLAKLATRMGTALTTTGEVARLVAPAWYCDPPVDLAGHKEALAALRERLDELEEGELPARLRQALGGAPLRSGVLETVVMWPELERQPHRLLELDELLDPGALSADTLRQAATILRRAGEPARAAALLEALLARRRLVPDGDDHVHHIEAGIATELTALGRPGEALRFLRRTARQRSAVQGGCGARLLAQGQALEQLHRRRAAERLYEQGLRAFPWDRQRIDRALRRVRAGLRAAT
jgi:tetratricopeptide (TPR) repeat protein